MAAPLDDVLVVDLTRALAGPHATMMLADLGARVIKVESSTGDDTRAWGPPWAGDPGPDDPHDSTYFWSANRNKESVVLDLKDAEEALLLDELVRRADVLVENFRHDTLDRLGWTVERMHELNPRLIVGKITGFGHDGPEADRAGYDQIAQGEGGLMSVTGLGEPTKVGVPIADLLAGMNLAYGVVAALHERARTNRGRVVRTSLLSSVVGAHGFQGTRWTLAGEDPGPSGTHHPVIAPYGLFHALDGPLQVAVGSEALWSRFASLLGLDGEDARYRTNQDRVAQRSVLIAEIDAVLRTDTAGAWLARFHAAGIPAGPVRSIPEVYQSDQARSQGLLIEVDHPDFGRLPLPGSPLRFDDETHSGGRARHLAPPSLDQHGEDIRDWLTRG